MTVLIGVVLAVVLAMCAARLPERALVWLYGALAVLTFGWLVFVRVYHPGYELASLLLLGVALSGTVRGESSAVIALPAVLLLPLCCILEGDSLLAVHTMWRALGLVAMGAGTGCMLRFAWYLSHRGDRAWLRPAYLTALFVGPVMMLACATSMRGANAWNVVLPMTSMKGVGAHLVALETSGARAWPWLAPLHHALPTALALMVVVAFLAFVVRPAQARDRRVMDGVALVVIVAAIGLVVWTPGGYQPLEHVDSTTVVAAMRPPFVAHDAMTYLAPETDVWHISRAAIALWLGACLWIAAAAMLATRVRAHAGEMRAERAILAPVLLLVGGLFLAAAWSNQAMTVSGQHGAEGLIFALAAFAGASVLLQARLRTFLCVLAAASSSAWIVAYVALRVLA